MAAKKKPAAVKAKRSKTGSPTPTNGTVPESQGLTDGEFVAKMFKSAEASIGRVADPARRTDLGKRFKALRAKFRGLAKSKVTRERAERYAEEVSKLEREAVGAYAPA